MKRDSEISDIPSISRLVRRLGLGIAVPLISLWVGSRAIELMVAIREFSPEAEARAFAIAEIVEQDIGASRHIAERLAREPWVALPGACERLKVIERVTDDIANFAVKTASGAVVCTTVGERPDVEWSNDNPWAWNPQETGDGPLSLGEVTPYQTAFSRAKKGVVSDLWVSSLAVPILDEAGQLTGVLEAVVALNRVQEIVVTHAQAEDDLITITDRSGRVVARSHQPLQWIGRLLPSSSIVLDPDSVEAYGSNTIAGADETIRVFGYSEIAGTPWLVYAGRSRSQLLRSIARQWVLMFAFGFLVILLVIFFGGRLSTKISRYLSNLGEQLEYSGPGAEIFLDEAVPEEIAEFARRYNVLLAERSTAMRAAATHGEIERSNMLREEFLATVSHELRTPLNAVLGMSEALQEGVYGALSDEQSPQVDLIYESGLHLLGVINQVLDFSKIQSDTLPLELEWVELSSLCETSARLVQPLAQKKDISYKFDDRAQGVRIQVDVQKIRQALVNLLSNAVKFTPDDGAVGMTVFMNPSNEKEVQIEVWDTGIGMSQEGLARLFVPFQQLDSSLARGHTGTGLGLVITQKLVEMHSGSLQVRSIEYEGTTVQITLPLE